MSTVASGEGLSRPAGNADTDLPIDVEVISVGVADAVSMHINTSTRAEIDLTTSRMLGHLRLLMGEELGADEDSNVRALFSEGYRLLELSKRPTPWTPSFAAFGYMTATSELTQRFLAAYTKRHQADDQ